MISILSEGLDVFATGLFYARKNVLNNDLLHKSSRVNANINPKASSCTFEMKYIRFSKHKQNKKKALLSLYIPHHTSTIYIKFRDFHIPNFIFTADSSKLVQRC